MIVGTVWEPIGPSPMQPGPREDNGLASSIAVNPNDPDVIYMGTAGGGVWRTVDGGENWSPLFDQQRYLGIGEPAAVALDPNDTDIVYVGASSRLTVQVDAPSTVDPNDVGLFRSTDAGASWVRMGSGFPAGNVGNVTQFEDQIINIIIVDPANSQTLYMATNQGLYRSLDGGLNWNRAAGNTGNDVRTLELDPTSPAGNGRILYAGITGQGVFQSTDGGQTLTPILTAATPVVAAALAGAGLSKVLVALAPPSAPAAAGGIQVLYAGLSGPGTAPPSDPVGLFVSTDQGANWTQQAAAGGPTNTQNGYSYHLGVDPASPGDGVNDIIYLGAVRHGVSTDSGANFTAINAPVHADNHAWAFGTRISDGQTLVFVGSDGGIYRSDDDGATWDDLNSGGLQTGLFYNLAVSPDATASVTLGTMQDNGIQTTAGAAAPAWFSGQGGSDGWDVVYDGVTPNRVYGSSGFWGSPRTRVFVSTADGTDFVSPNAVPGTPTDITPWNGFTTGDPDDGGFIASMASDPGNAGVVYVAGLQNLWQTRDGGTTWNIIGSFGQTPIPGFNPSARQSVAPSDGNNVVVASASQVFVSTNALGPVASVSFANLTRNLPNRNVLRAEFDPNDPSIIYAVLGGYINGGHVFRTTLGSTTWTDISPDLDCPFGALALDGSTTPTTIYVGTDLGVLRSVDVGATWYVLDDIRFPKAPVTDLAIGRAAGVLRAATYGRGVFEFAVPTGPAITVNLQDGLDFGTVCDGPGLPGTERLTLQVFNLGARDLTINSVQRLMGSTGFAVDPLPATPLVISPGDEVDFTVAFTPTAPGVPEVATIRIASDDPNAPVVDLTATGIGGTASAELVFADGGDFGEVCLTEFVDRDLIINNAGACPLEITAISSSSADFVAPGVIAFPLIVAPGASITVPVRFQPTVLGAASATISVFSNDPASPAQVDVTGTAPPPRLVMSIADSGDFGDVCVGDFGDLPLTLSNSGRCPLTITALSSNSAEFLVPAVLAFPVVIAAGAAIDVELRFQPTSFGSKSATITVTSDDPASPASLDVSGTAPTGTIAVTGTTAFGAVELGDRALQALSICNVGDCDLEVTRVGFKPLSRCDEYRHCRCGGCGCGSGCNCRKDCGCNKKRKADDYDDSKHDCDCDQKCLNFTIVSNPFPTRLHPGACLDVLIQYIPTCDNAACCELIIESDDPDEPTQTLLVTGHLRRTLHSAVKCWAGQQLADLLAAGKGCS